MTNSVTGADFKPHQVTNIVILTFFSWTHPGKEGSPAEPKIQSTGFWGHCRVDSLAVAHLIVDAPIRTHCQTQAPQPRLPSPSRSCMHRPVEQNPGRTVAIFFVSVALGYQEGGRTNLDFLWSAQPLTWTRAWGSPGESEDKVWRNKKAEDKLTGEEKRKKLEELKVGKMTKLDICEGKWVVRFAFKRWLKERSRKVLKC